VPERTAEQIRKQITTEQAGLHDDVDALKAELRSLIPLLVAGFLVLVLLGVALFTGFRKLRRLG
jgi:hypothetical protein